MYPFIHIGFLDKNIPSYGLALGLSVFCGFLFARRQMAKRLSLSTERADIFLSFLILGSILGARTFALVFESDLPLAAIPSHLLRFNAAGVTFYGGFLAAVAVIVVFCWGFKVNFWQLADIITVPLSFGLGLTRIGCFMAGCCWGTPANVPWAVTFTHPQAITPLKHLSLHPAQLYHSAANFLNFFIIIAIYYRYRHRPQGFVFAAFLLLYAVARFFTEYFRGDDVRGYLFNFLSISQFISLFVFSAGLVIMVMMVARRD